MNDVGRTLIILGVVLVVVGIFFSVSGKVPFLGKMPGDILIKKENFIFYAPIATSIVISIILTLILNMFFGGKK